jgi:hypothetical protein
VEGAYREDEGNIVENGDVFAEEEGGGGMTNSGTYPQEGMWVCVCGS